MRVLLALVLMAGSAFAALPWKPAQFKGLTLGKAKKADLVRVLGNPDSAQTKNGSEELTYKKRGNHGGDILANVRTGDGVVSELHESLPVSTPRTVLYKQFGKTPVTAQFSTAACAANALYRDPRGPIELVMYPDQGVAFWPDQYGYDIAAIYYFAKKPGLDTPPSCVKSSGAKAK